MTALLSRDGTNFTLACDRCGQLVADLADTMHRWDLAWVQLRRHGWSGAALATGPHACPCCTQAPGAAQMAEQVTGRQRSAPSRRRSNRITVTEHPLATVVEVRGGPGVAVNAALYELLLDRPPRRHVIVDLSRAGALDSGALGVLVRAHAHAAGYAFELCLVGLSGPMNGALRLLCLTHILPTFADRAEALTWLRGPAPDRPTAPRRVTADERVLEVA